MLCHDTGTYVYEVGDVSFIILSYRLKYVYGVPEYVP